MASLREQKKASTREAIARAAADIVVTDGVDGLTVAAVARQAEISPRTFHNYFSSMEAALLWFISLHSQAFTEAFAQIPADVPVVETARLSLVALYNPEHPDAASMVRLIRVGEALTAMPHSLEARVAMEKDGSIPNPLEEAVTSRLPDADSFVIDLYAAFISTAVSTALEHYACMDEPKDLEDLTALLDRAFRTLSNVQRP